MFEVCVKVKKNGKLVNILFFPCFIDLGEKMSFYEFRKVSKINAGLFLLGGRLCSKRRCSARPGGKLLRFHREQLQEHEACRGREQTRANFPHICGAGGV